MAVGASRILGLLVALLIAVPPIPIDDRPWMDTSLAPATRAARLMQEMTLDDKIALMRGAAGSPYVGYVPPNARLGIPALSLEDGPAGVGDHLTGVTQLPAPVAAAASWDPSLMHSYGSVVGAEEAGKGANVNLGPTVNIMRVPLWGRAFESLGEDPYLSSRMAAADIRGVQSQGVIATVKHWGVYNQETYRNTPADDAIVSERAIQEIYTPAFRAAVQQGGAGAAMCSYSSINGDFACQNHYLLTTVLREQLGFRGWVLSDWYATHSTVASARAGLDMEMPDAPYFGVALRQAVQSGRVPVSVLDGAVRRILTQMFRFGLFDRPQTGDPNQVVTSPQHAAVARTAAEQGTVLLKNDGGLLPLGGARSIAVIGPDASTDPWSAGGGSAGVLASHVVTPLAGIKSRAGSHVTVRYAQGAGSPTQPPPPAARRKALLKQAADAARRSDIAVVFVNDLESEFGDRTSLDLPGDQNQLIATVAQANPRTVVVLNTGAPVLMPWVAHVPAVVEAWYPGQEDGNAIAAVLFGDANPCGKLPMTFPATADQVAAATTAQYPGVGGQVQYQEGIFVGYRWYDEHGVPPLFPFGHGLSYTTFAMSHLTAVPSKDGGVVAGLDVTNTGRRAGAEVAQLYLGFPPIVGEPPLQLRGFQKVFLEPGQTRHVALELTRPDLSYWDAGSHGWVVPTGPFELAAGSSSRDLQARMTFSAPS